MQQRGPKLWRKWKVNKTYGSVFKKTGTIYMEEQKKIEEMNPAMIEKNSQGMTAQRKPRLTDQRAQEGK